MIVTDAILRNPAELSDEELSAAMSALSSASYTLHVARLRAKFAREIASRKLLRGGAIVAPPSDLLPVLAYYVN